jgi:hypothetical protein
LGGSGSKPVVAAETFTNLPHSRVKTPTRYTTPSNDTECFNNNNNNNNNVIQKEDENIFKYKDLTIEM